MTLGEKIQFLRKKAGLSQEQLAEELNVSRQSVSKWESDAATPDTDKIRSISVLFDVSADYLLFDQCEMSPEDGEPAERGTDADAQPSDDPESVSADTDAEIPGENDRPDHKKRILFIVMLCVAACCALAAAGILAAHLIGVSREKKAAKDNGTTLATEQNAEITDAASAASDGVSDGENGGYPYILVHGLGGWGDGAGINNIAKYWGADTGDLAEYLRGEGYEVYTPSVGPVSSTWDRVCELYAQLVGGTVDYGAAHSRTHNHARYGRSYPTPLVPGWGEKGDHARVNLIGHSFGGATVRMLASLLAYGDADEIAEGEGVSPLFLGGNALLVNSITTLCAPHNGSSLTCVLDDLGSSIGCDNATELLATLCFAAEGIAAPVKGIYDLRLDQFGIGPITGGLPEIVDALGAVTRSDNDHAGYDLSPDGAAALNAGIATLPDVLYISYSYSTTEKGRIVYSQVPTAITLPVLYPFALAMGGYTGVTPGGISIDASWQENDGLVSVVSARCPFDAPYREYDGTLPRGVWNVMPVREGHHGTVIGLGAGKQATQSFYDELFRMIENAR